LTGYLGESVKGPSSRNGLPGSPGRPWAGGKYPRGAEEGARSSPGTSPTSQKTTITITPWAHNIANACCNVCFKGVIRHRL